MGSGIETQDATSKAGTKFWRNVSECKRKHGTLSLKEAGVLAVATGTPMRLSSEKQLLLLVALLPKLQAEGFELALDLETAD